MIVALVGTTRTECCMAAPYKQLLIESLVYQSKSHSVYHLIQTALLDHGSQCCIQLSTSDSKSNTAVAVAVVVCMHAVLTHLGSVSSTSTLGPLSSGPNAHTLRAASMSHWYLL
jgi:hypothetical protein